MTLSDAHDLVALLKAACPGWKAEDATAGVWHSLLEDLDAQAVSVATKRLLVSRRNPFPPAVGEIRAEVARQGAPELMTSPEEAWGEVMRQVRRVGWCGTPQWSSAAVENAVQAIGWRELCLSEQGDVGVRAHFFRCFAAYQARAMEARGIPSNLQLRKQSRPQLMADRVAPATDPVQTLTVEHLEANRKRLRLLIAQVAK
jgi:hypothetical protein